MPICVSSHPSPRFQDSKIPRFERWNLGNLRWNLGLAPFTLGSLPCYIGSVTPVKRDRDWSPVESAATRAAASAMECGFVIRAPFLVARQAGASLAGSRKRVPGRPTCRATALIGLRAVVYANRTCLEATMAATPRALAPASPTTGTPDSIQLHAQAHNAVAMALHYLSQPQANIDAARRKAAQALSALRGLDLSLEG